MSPLKKKKSRSVCCVVGCKNMYKNTEGIKFYKFPSRPWDFELRKKWIEAIDRKNHDGSAWEPTWCSFICSAHFHGNRKVNHPSSPSYIPTIFPFTETKVKGPKRKKIVNSTVTTRSLQQSKDPLEPESKGPPTAPDSPGGSIKIEIEDYQFLDEDCKSIIDIDSSGSADRDSVHRGERATQEKTRDRKVNLSSNVNGCDGLSTIDDALSHATIKLNKPPNSNRTTVSRKDAPSHSFRNSPLNQSVSLPKNSVENKFDMKILNMTSKLHGIKTCNLMKVPSDKDNVNNSSSSNIKENISVNVLSENISEDKNELELNRSDICIKELLIQDRNELDTVVDSSDICIEELSVVESNDGSLRCGKDVVVSFPPISDGTQVKPMVESIVVGEVHLEERGEEIELLPVEIHNESLEEFDEDVLDRGLDLNKPRMSERCRVCAEIKDNMLDLLDEAGEQIHLVETLSKYLNIDISADKIGFPHFICQLCALTVHVWDDLKQLAVTGSEILNKLFNEENEQRETYLSCPSPVEVPAPTESLVDFEESKTEYELATMYKCTICAEVFPFPRGLKDHFNKEHSSCDTSNVSTPSLHCSFCIDSFKSTVALKRHAVINHGKHICKFCLDWFDTERLLYRHIREIHIFKCPFCNHEETKKYYIIQHIKVNHKDKEPKNFIINWPMEKVHCKICNLKLSGRDRLKSHYFWVHLKYACELCCEYFLTSEEQVSHVKEIHVIPCEKCDSIFYSSRRLKRHFNQAHKEVSSNTNILPKLKSDTLKYECKTCNKGISTKIFLKRHTYWSHKKYICDFCLQEFKSVELEEKHCMVNHSNVCVFCNERQLDFDSLKVHLATEHHDLKPFACENCGQTFINRKELNTHRKEHEKDKNHLCHICGASFYLEAHLTTHKYTHLSESEKGKVTCAVCNKKFMFLHLLKRHMTVHTQERAYKCLDCKTSFLNAAALKTHLKSHAKVHTCDQCNFELKSKKKLTSHIKAIHSNKEIFQCSLCQKRFVSESDAIFHISFHSENDVNRFDNPIDKVLTLQCGFCDKIFSHKNKLSCHIKMHLKKNRMKGNFKCKKYS